MSTTAAQSAESVTCPATRDDAPQDHGLPRADMPRGSVYFAGVLHVVRSGRRGRPTILVSTFCPFCQDHHSYNWRSALPVTPDVVILVRARCKAGPWKKHEVYVGLAANEPAMERSRKVHANALVEYAEWAEGLKRDGAQAEEAS